MGLNLGKLFNVLSKEAAEGPVEKLLVAVISRGLEGVWFQRQ